MCPVRIEKATTVSPKVLDELQEFAKRYGATALAWIKLGDEISSSLLKAMGDTQVQLLAKTAGAENGDAVLIVAGKSKTVAASLGALRNEIARRENLIPQNLYAPLWVTEFPMFEFHEEDGRYYSMHHPFTSPFDEDLPLLDRAVEGRRAITETLLFFLGPSSHTTLRVLLGGDDILIVGRRGDRAVVAAAVEVRDGRIVDIDALIT